MGWPRGGFVTRSVTHLEPFSSQSLYRGRGINQVPWSSLIWINHLKWDIYHFTSYRKMFYCHAQRAGLAEPSSVSCTPFPPRACIGGVASTRFPGLVLLYQFQIPICFRLFQMISLAQYRAIIGCWACVPRGNGKSLLVTLGKLLIKLRGETTNTLFRPDWELFKDDSLSTEQVIRRADKKYPLLQ